MFKILAHQFRRHWVWLKWAFAAAILAWLFYQNPKAFTELPWGELKWGYLISGLALCGVAFLITFARWYLLVVNQGIPFRWSDSVRLGFIGILFTYVAPGAAGGDIIKALLIAKEQPKHRAKAAASVLLDRILGLIALFIVGAAASLLYFPLPESAVFDSIVAFLWIGAAAGLAGLVLLLHTPLPRSRFVKWFFRLPGIGNALWEIQQGFLMYQERKRVLWSAVGISIVGHFCFLTVFYLASQSQGVGEFVPDYDGHLLLVPGAEVAGVVVPTPAGFGALEGAVRYVFELSYSVDAPAATEEQLAAARTAGLRTAILFRLTHLSIALIGVGFYLTTRREIGEVLEEEEHVLDEGSEPPQ